LAEVVLSNDQVSKYLRVYRCGYVVTMTVAHF